MSPLLLALRADAHQTHAQLSQLDGPSWDTVRIANHEARSSRELLERAFQEACLEVCGPLPPVVAIAALPGLHSAALRRAAAETVKSFLPRGSRVVLCDALEPLLAAGLQGEAGHLLCSGHEAGVATISLDGVFTRTEEEPDLMGQEGSGLWLGTRTLQLTARLLEGRLAEAPRLTQALTEHFAQSNLAEVWDQVMRQPPDVSEILALSARTIALAELPDPEPACRALVVRAARRLGELLAIANREPMGETPYATWHGPSATGALLREVVRQTPELTWQPPRLDAMEGCLSLLRAFGTEGLGQGESVVEDAAPPLWLALRQGKSQYFPTA